jgi:hypothetical protein
MGNHFARSARYMGNRFDRHVKYTGNRFGISVGVIKIAFIGLGICGIWRIISTDLRSIGPMASGDSL